MAFSHDGIYRFGGFEFDPTRLALYFQGEFLKVERKSLEVLAVLAAAPRELVPTSEIIDRVWRDNPAGVGSVHVAQNIRKLRRVFADRDGGTEYIKNVKGVGYIFDRDVSHEVRVPLTAPPGFDQNLSGTHADATQLSLGGEEPSRGQNLLSPSESAGYRFSKAERTVPPVSFPVRYRLVAGVGIALVFLLGPAWYFMTSNEGDEVRRVVLESQLFESLVLYKRPERFNEPDLDRFWTPELDIDSNYDRRRIRDAVEKLVSDGRRYGDESKCEQFDFQSVEVSADGKTAVVKTLEKWFAAVYFNDGTLEKNRTIGPYFVSYILKKIDGRWLIEKSNTARANVSPPKLKVIDPVDPIRAGEQFLINISGEDFLPELAHVKLTGPGCPEASPCSVPNSVLRDHAKMSATELLRVPLTLSSGEFMIYAHNGESQPSNRVSFRVP